MTVSLIEGKFLLEETQKDHKTEMVNHQKALVLACKMLQQVLGNENFRKAVRQLAKARSENEEEFVKIATNLNLLDEFFQREHKLLEEHGVPMAETLINEGRKALVDVRAGNAPHTKIYESLARLGKASCGLEHDLREQITEAIESE